MLPHPIRRTASSQQLQMPWPHQQQQNQHHCDLSITRWCGYVLFRARWPQRLWALWRLMWRKCGNFNLEPLTNTCQKWWVESRHQNQVSPKSTTTQNIVTNNAKSDLQSTFFYLPQTKGSLWKLLIIYTQRLALCVCWFATSWVGWF